MSHIDIAEFLRVNASVISGIQIYRSGQYISIDSNVSSEADAPMLIRPMEAVFVVAKNSSTDLTVTITEAMQKQANQVITTRTASTSAPQLRLTAGANRQSVSCVVLQSASASDGYSSGEDVTLLVESEEQPEVAVFTVAGGKALSIQRMASATRIPVGFFVKESCDVRLSFEAKGTAWNGWILVDSRTGQHYPLTESITLRDVSTESTRFYLEKGR